MATLEDDARALLDPIEHRRLHDDARLIAALYPELLGLGDGRRVTGCPFDQHTATAHTPLGAFMRANARRAS